MLQRAAGRCEAVQEDTELASEYPFEHSHVCIGHSVSMNHRPTVSRFGRDFPLQKQPLSAGTVGHLITTQTKQFLK